MGSKGLEHPERLIMSGLFIMGLAGLVVLLLTLLVASQEGEREQMRKTARYWSARQQRKG
jgi:hypothetical protein